MSRGPATVRQADIVRALRAARAAGLEVSGYEIDPAGKITITTNSTGDDKKPVDEFEKWKAGHAR
jgi:hypothetical protein